MIISKPNYMCIDDDDDDDIYREKNKIKTNIILL
jgi:hypothetical protein